MTDRHEQRHPGPAGPDPAPPEPSGAVHPVPDVLSYLAGRWRVHRSVADLGGGGRGVFEGTAAFTGGADGVLCHAEEGTFTWRGTARPARRAHRYLPLGDGTASVAFEDGRPFHLLDLRTGRWTARHPCAADRYLGRFTVLGPDRWQVVWTVRGPGKDVRMSTVHERLRPVVPPGVWSPGRQMSHPTSPPGDPRDPGQTMERSGAR